MNTDPQFQQTRGNITPSLFINKVQPFDTPSSFIKRPVPSRSPIANEGAIVGARPTSLSIEREDNSSMSSKENKENLPQSPFKRLSMGNSTEMVNLTAGEKEMN